MADLFAVNGETPEEVEVQQNVPDVMTPFLTVTPTRGQFLRFLNHVASGDATGLPLYQELVDTNGDPMPATTQLVLKAKGAGMTEAVKVSELVRNISYWNSHSIKEQRNEENVDGSKVVLEWPENAPNSGPRDHVDITDLGELQLCAKSPQVIDPNAIRVFFDKNGVKEYTNSGGN